MKVPFCAASTRAAPDPMIPTQIPQVRLVKPQMNPAAKTAYAFFLASWNLVGSVIPDGSLLNSHSFGLPLSRMETITP